MAFYAVPWEASEFLEMYPQFQSSCSEQAGYISTAQLDSLWQMATSIVSNTEASAIVPYDPSNGVYKRKIILYALMCHLATMALWGASGQSGAVQSASEGSVSASFHMPQFPGGGNVAQWYNQTLCGRSVWALLRKYSLGGLYYGIEYYHPFG